MYNYLIYLIKVSLLIIIFLGVYQLSFRSVKHFHKNRAFLLSGIILPWILPLVNIPIFTGGLPILPDWITAPVNGSPSIGQSFQIIPATQQISEIHNAGSISGQFPWWIIYWIGVALFTLRALLGVIQIIKIRMRNTVHRNQKITFVTGSQLPAFSFFRWIFLDDGRNGKSDYNLVIAHELAHVRQRHTMDLFLVEFVHMLLWFNPLIILYKRTLKECHEFLADDAVLKEGIPLLDYARSHQKEAIARSNQKLASYFEGSSLKRRLLMAIKKEKPYAGLRYLIVIPLFIGALLMFSCNGKPTELSMETTKNVFDFPLRSGEKFRISEYFSLRRMHPILGIYRPHPGIDIDAAIGTPVLASDNGVVKEISNSRVYNGNGVSVLIEHSNGYETFYAHLNKTLVKEHEAVKRGQIIGEVGNTGMVIGPQVHFEIRKNGTAVDPADYVIALDKDQKPIPMK